DGLPIDPGTPIVFTLSSAAGTQTATGTTAADGSASVNFTPTHRGSFTVTVSFHGDTCLNAALSFTTPVTVYQRVKLVFVPGSVGSGSSVTLRAALTALPGDTPVAGQIVNIDFGGAAPAQSALTDSNGVATVTLVPTGSFVATGSFPMRRTSSQIT